MNSSEGEVQTVAAPGTPSFIGDYKAVLSTARRTVGLVAFAR